MSNIDDKALQMAPKREPDSFTPSKVMVKGVTPTIKTFREIDVETPYRGDKKILVLCSSKYLLECENGAYFNTGHQATETLLPMYHWNRCGFNYDIATPYGGPVAFEEWTFPPAEGYEQHLWEIRNANKKQFEAPKRFADISTNDLGSTYAAIFFPGGHGPLVDLHKEAHLGAILRAAHEQEIITISLCHGPTALRAGAYKYDGEFPYKGYKCVCFPDGGDHWLAESGYLPGYLKKEDKLEAALKELGMEVQNTGMDDSTCVDRELITGASSLSSQALSEVVVSSLAAKFDFKTSVGEA